MTFITKAFLMLLPFASVVATDLKEDPQNPSSVARLSSDQQALLDQLKSDPSLSDTLTPPQATPVTRTDSVKPQDQDKEQPKAKKHRKSRRTTCFLS